MSITIEQIRALREKTGAGMMDCKEALKGSDGDVEKAVVFLRKKGLADIKSRSHKSASEGTIGYYIHAGEKIGVMVEVNCETDFVAKSDDFKAFAKDLAMHVAATNPQWLSRECVPSDVVDREVDIIKSDIKNKPENVVEKIVEGRLNKFFKETCLMDQLFVKDTNITITDLMGDLASKIGENIVIKRFVRFSVGESV